MVWACAFARASAGNNKPARMAMMAITTSNSIRVKPDPAAAAPEAWPALLAAANSERAERKAGILPATRARQREPIAGNARALADGRRLEARPALMGTGTIISGAARVRMASGFRQHE